MSVKLLPVATGTDILSQYRDNAVGDLLRYHNLRDTFREYNKAELLISMCMDNRKSLRTPDNFAFILRTGGANLHRVEFKLSFAVAIGEVKTVCLIGHSDCRMVNLHSRRNEFIDGLVSRGGWDAVNASKHFDTHVKEFNISDAAEFTFTEAVRLRDRYPLVTIAPLYYKVEDGLLYQIAQ